MSSEKWRPYGLGLSVLNQVSSWDTINPNSRKLYGIPVFQSSMDQSN